MRRFRLAPRGGQNGARPGFRAIQHGECALGSLEGRFCLPGRCVRIGGRAPACSGRRPKCHVEALGVCAMANFHCDGRCLPPLSETPCAAIGRCARRGSYVSLGGPIERQGHLRFVPQTPRKAISVFFVPPPDLLLQYPVTDGPMPAWALRRARRGRDIHSVLVRGVFVRVRARSRIVRRRLHEGWYPPNTEVNLSRTRVPGVLGESGWAYRAAGATPICTKPLSEGDFGLFRAGIEPSPAVFGRRWPHAGLGATAGYAES
jgi:hypothetical protein